MSNSSKEPKQTNLIDQEIWKFNRINAILTKDLQNIDFIGEIYKNEHQQLVKRISQLDQIIRANEQFSKSKEQEIVDNTRYIQELKQYKRSNPNNK